MVEFGFLKVTVTGTAWDEPISAPGLKVGDRLLLSYAPGVPGALQSIITVDDEIQRNQSGDWTSNTFDLIFLRGI